MGYAISWFAVPQQQTETFLNRFQLVPTGATNDFPDSLISFGKFDTGWTVLWYGRYGCPFLREKELTTISKDYDILCCKVEEHVMASSSELWSGGARKWLISHEGENGPKGLDIEGTPPESLSAIRQEMEATQLAEGGDDAEVDYIFEIPLAVAEKIVGFKHDSDSPHLIGKQFLSLKQTTSASGFFGRFFGKG
ncbi:MAG: hypothetical protein QM715_04385 [Nibricoccus sp.]